MLQCDLRIYLVPFFPSVSNHHSTLNAIRPDYVVCTSIFFANVSTMEYTLPIDSHKLFRYLTIASSTHDTRPLVVSPQIMHDPDARYIRHIEVFSAENERMLRKSSRKRTTAKTATQDSSELPARVHCQVVCAYGRLRILSHMDFVC